MRRGTAYVVGRLTVGRWLIILGLRLGKKVTGEGIMVILWYRRSADGWVYSHVGGSKPEEGFWRKLEAVPRGDGRLETVRATNI